MFAFDPYRTINEMNEEQNDVALSLQHVLEWLASKECMLAATTKNQYRVCVLRYAKLQRREPKSIEANASLIKESMPLSAYRSMGCKSVGAFNTMRRCIVAAIKGATGELAEKRALEQQRDDWFELLEAIDDWRFLEPDIAPSKEESIPLKIIADIARRVGIIPQNLSSIPVETILSQPMRKRQKEPAKRAFHYIRYLQKNAPEPVRKLLPEDLVPLPPEAQRHFIVPDGLRDEIAAWVELASRGVWSPTDEDYVAGTTPKNYYRALVKILATLSETKFTNLESIETIATVLDQSEIVHCVKTWKDWHKADHPRAIASKTAYNYLYSIVKLIEKNGGSPDHIRYILKTDKWLRSHKQRDSKMTEKAQTFCRGVVTNKSERLKFVSSAISCQKKSKKYLNDMIHGSEKKRDENRKLAIRFGVSAAFAAIQIDASPVRASPVLRETFRGDDAWLDLGVSPKSDGRLCIPASENKNKKEPSAPLLASSPTRGLEILRWYEREIRPLLDPADSNDFFFPAPKNPQGHLSYSTFRTWWDDCVLEIGLPGMTPHMFRHGLASIIAAENPGNWALLAALLGDAESTCRDYYAWIDREQLILQGHDYITKGMPHAAAA